jgi:hypothetical protein
LFDEFGTETVATLSSRASQIEASQQGQHSEQGAVTGHLAGARLDQLANLLAVAGAKAAVVRDVRSVAKLLHRLNESETLASVIVKLRDIMQPPETQIERFIERLKKDTGTAGFERTFSELVSSPLKKEDIVTIALSVYGGIKKSTSKKGALAYIRKPHDAHVSAKKGIDATGGRSAA